MHRSKLALQTIAMPCHTNSNGDIFGGWIISQMDLGGAVIAQTVSKSRVVTAAIESIQFKHPVAVGDIVSCRGTLQHVGNTSMRIKMECWVQRDDMVKKVTEGIFTFVAISSDTRKPRPIFPQPLPLPQTLEMD
jgi:acyl-CoA thioesterase YciA